MVYMGENDIYEQLKKIQNKLDGEIGYMWWKRYVSSAFWNHFATTVNFSMTILTVLISGQTNTKGIFSEDVYKDITILTVVLSTINTFFSPHTQLSKNIDSMNKYSEFGTKLEEIYYTKIDNVDEIKNKIEQYTTLLLEINKFRNSQESERSQNVITDVIHAVFRRVWLKDKERWLDLDNELIEDAIRDAETIRNKLEIINCDK